MSLKRKLQRNKKKQAEKDLKDKIMSFDRLPDCCVICYKDFDKKSREMAMSWKVVERREVKRVSLFCPDCWDNGMGTVKEQLTKKQTELDRILNSKQDQTLKKKKMSPKREDFPDVQDYVHKDVPQVATPDDGGEDE